MSAQGMLETFRALDLDHYAVGLGRSPGASPHFCTPVGAEIVGWTGVDGIHFCRIPAVVPELVFVVTPIPCGERHVEPVAEDFETFLRLVLACGGGGLLEQVSWLGEDQFEELLNQERAALSAAQVQALEKIGPAFGLVPHPAPYAYVKSLQTSFDYTTIPFSEEYYEVTGAERPDGHTV